MVVVLHKVGYMEETSVRLRMFKERECHGCFHRSNSDCERENGNA